MFKKTQKKNLIKSDTWTLQVPKQMKRMLYTSQSSWGVHIIVVNPSRPKSMGLLSYQTFEFPQA
jgi:hypothetical protein